MATKFCIELVWSKGDPLVSHEEHTTYCPFALGVIGGVR